MEKEHGMAAVEASESKFEKAMQERHKIAVTGYRLEQMVWGENPPSKEEAIVFIRDQKLPKSAEMSFEKLAEEFFAKEEQLDFVQDRVEHVLEGPLEENEERAGWVLFRTKNQGKKPNGRVWLRRRPGFFLLEFESPEDFGTTFDEKLVEFHGKVYCLTQGLFAQGYSVYIPEGGRNPESFDIYHDWLEKIDQLTVGEAIEHEAPSDPFEEIFDFDEREMVPVISLHSQPEYDPQFIKRSLLAHERQHAIFRYFSDENDPFDHIRNELLARIRGADDAHASTRFLEADRYSYAQEDLDWNQKENVKTLLESIRKPLEKLERLFPGDLRAILTYHLLDVPLEKIAKRLESIRLFYGKFLDPVFSFVPPDENDYRDDYIALVQDFRHGFMGGNENEAKRVLYTYENWSSKYIAACEGLIAKPDAVRAKKLAQELATLKQVAEKTYADYREQDSSTRVS